MLSNTSSTSYVANFLLSFLRRGPSARSVLDCLYISNGCDAHRRDPMLGGGLTSLGYAFALAFLIDPETNTKNQNVCGPETKVILGSEGGYNPRSNFDIYKRQTEVLIGRSKLADLWSAIRNGEVPAGEDWTYEDMISFLLLFYCGCGETRAVVLYGGDPRRDAGGHRLVFTVIWICPKQFIPAIRRSR